MFSKLICFIFAENKIFEKSKMAAKMADMLWNDRYHKQQFLIKNWKMYLAEQKLLICQSLIFQLFGK